MKNIHRIYLERKDEGNDMDMFNEIKTTINDVLSSNESPRTKDRLIEQAMAKIDLEVVSSGKGLGDVTPQTVDGSSFSYEVSGNESISAEARGQAVASATMGVPRMEDLEAWVEETGVDLDLDDLDAIEELDFSESDLTDLPQSLILVSSNVTEFALEKNSISIIPGPVLGSFTSLVELYLRENQLTSLPEELGNCESLDSLYLEDNLLTSLPKSLSNLSNLKGLCLHRNQFTECPESIFGATSLEELYLDENSISVIPDGIGNLVNLKELGIQKNKLSGCLPDSIGSLSKLETLHTEFNELNELPKSFGKCKALRKLYMNDNKFEKLHACLGKCPKLEVINAENNCITKIAKRIKDIPLLRFLLLANNSLTALPFDPTASAPGLRRLTLSGNQLDEVTMKLEKMETLNEEEG